MKATTPTPVEVYRVIDRRTGAPQSAYSRAYHDEFDFTGPEEARTSNVHGLYEDKKQYAIAKYRVTYTLLDGNCD